MTLPARGALVASLLLTFAESALGAPPQGRQRYFDVDELYSSIVPRQQQDHWSLPCGDGDGDCSLLATLLLRDVMTVLDPLEQRALLQDLTPRRAREPRPLPPRDVRHKRVLDPISRNSDFGYSNRNYAASPGNDHLTFTFESLFPAIARSLRSTSEDPRVSPPRVGRSGWSQLALRGTTFAN